MMPISSRVNFWRAAALALSASLCTLLCAEPAGARATYVTFDAWFVTGINGSDTVTGWASNEVDSFVRTVDGTITTFAVPRASWTTASGINDGGSVAGVYSTGAEHGFVRAADGTITTFDVPGAANGIIGVSALNNKGKIVGYYYDKSDNGRGFARAADGKIRTVDVPGAQETYLVGINDRNVMVGEDTAKDGHVQGFVRAADGTFATFDVPAADATLPAAINVKGTVTGYYYSGSSRQGFVRSSDGTITTFGLPDCSDTVPTAINRKGVIAGVCDTLGFVRHQDGSIRKFHVPHEGKWTLPAGINDAGVITGNYMTDTGVPGFVRFR